MDQMVHLLNKDLETNLTDPITQLSPTYKKAPNESPFQDLEGILYLDQVILLKLYHTQKEEDQQAGFLVNNFFL